MEMMEAIEAARFSEAWGSLQNRFVDNPKQAVSHLSNRSRAYVRPFVSRRFRTDSGRKAIPIEDGQCCIGF
jgi:hypothetical protein